MEREGALSARHAERRARVLERLGERAALVLAASPELVVGEDTDVRYSPDPSLFYLTGYTEPQAVLVLCPSAEQGSCTLFVRPRDPERELWSGRRGGVEEAKDRFGADVAWPIAELPALLPKLLEHIDVLYYRLGSTEELDRIARALLAHGRKRRPRRGSGLHTIADPSLLLDELRVLKDADEIAALRRACSVACDSFAAVRDQVRPGAGEWQIEAALEYEFRRRGASGPAFPTIVGSGVNATVLHYTSNESVLRAGELVLIDAGPRVAQYCADITRTYPVSGRFTAEQQALYDVVRSAHRAGIDAARPGAPAAGVHDAAVRALVEGLVHLGFLRGDPTGLVEQGDAWKRFYPHRTSHWLGLDVHDVGAYVDGAAARALEPGMVLTVEPGLYIPADQEAGPQSLRGTGIRLEDDVLVTPDGPLVLTAALPLEP